jgi:hypothetical protein
MTDAAQVPNGADIRTIEVERDWLDGLKALNELFDQAEDSRRRWVRIGKGLLAGRRKCPADRDFNEWLDYTNYRMVSRDERSSAMWLCVNAAIVLPALQETRIANPEWARRHVRINLPSIYAQCDEVRSVAEVSATDVVPTSEPEAQPIEPPAAEKVVLAIPEKAESEAQSKLADLPRKQMRNQGRQSPIAGLPDADLVYAHMLENKARSAIGKFVRTSKGRPVWPLLIESIETGLFGPPSTVDATELMTVRVLLPWLPVRSFTGLSLKDSYSVKLVREILFPLVRERPELRETPHLVEREFEARRRATEEAARRQSKLDEHRAKVEAGAIGVGEQPIIAYGEPLWPPQRADISLPYTYAELCHATYFVSYFLGIARADWRPTETAMAGRHLAKYIEPVQPGFVAAVRVIFNAYEDHPDGEKQFPPIPVNFGN